VHAASSGGGARGRVGAQREMAHAGGEGEGAHGLHAMLLSECSEPSDATRRVGVRDREEWHGGRAGRTGDEAAVGTLSPRGAGFLEITITITGRGALLLRGDTVHTSNCGHVSPTGSNAMAMAETTETQTHFSRDGARLSPALMSRHVARDLSACTHHSLDIAISCDPCDTPVDPALLPRQCRGPDSCCCPALTYSWHLMACVRVSPPPLRSGCPASGCGSAAPR